MRVRFPPFAFFQASQTMSSKRFFLIFSFFLLSTSSLLALKVDPSSSVYELKERKFRVDVFDFSGEYPHLENIDIDARRKKRVEMLLTGEYPLLESINYEGTFGSMIGKFTGSFPKLTLANFVSSSASMQFDLTGEWKQSCEINIRGTTGQILVILPKDVNVTVNTKTGALGKVINNTLIKKGWGVLSKTFVNKQVPDESATHLVVNIETEKGKITLD